MRRYAQVSGTLFTVVSLAQLTRAVLALPAQVGNTAIPVWPSVIAFMVTGLMAVWAFRTAGRVG